MDIGFSTELNERKQLTNACWQVNLIKMENPTPVNRVVVVRRISYFSKLGFLQSFDWFSERTGASLYDIEHTGSSSTQI